MRILTTFYGRLSLLFLGLVVVLGAGTYALVAPGFVSFLCETDQRINFHLAGEMADQLEPLMAERLDHAAMRERVAYLNGINPLVDIYVVGGDGTIRTHFSRQDRPLEMSAIDVEPLHALLAGGALPIWGNDPLRPGARRPFSVAPVTVMGDPDNFVYVVVGGERYYTVGAAMRHSSIMQSSMRGIGYILLISIGTGLLLFFRVTRRVRAVSEAVGRFAEGDLDRRLADESADELGQLARSFNSMADTIAASMKELEQTDRLRRELIANVSHDLRSPLASIQGYLETIQIKDGSLTPEQRREHMEVVLRNAGRLNKLVSELFELSKLEAEQVTPQWETFSVAELVQDLVMQFKPQAEARGVDLEAALPERISLVRADIALVERALGNLIENALTYTSRGGCVRVVPAQDVDRVRIEVCDTGEGIPEAELAHVFDRFYQMEKERGDGSGGLGLGLAIAQKIAELHGTKLTVSSRIDGGTRFGLALPTSPRLAS